METRSDDLDFTDAPQWTAADAEDAEHHADGRKARSERDAGSGTVELDLTPEAHAEGTFILSGARPGIDGACRIAGVTHRADRSGGATTTHDLAQPSVEVGMDKRIATPAPRSAA